MSIAALDETFVNFPANSFFKNDLENGNTLYFVFDRKQGIVYSEEYDPSGNIVGERKDLLDGFSKTDVAIGGEYLANGTYLLSFSDVTDPGNRFHFQNIQYFFDKDGTLLNSSTSIEDSEGVSPKSQFVQLSNGGHVEITQYLEYGVGTIALQSVFDAGGSLVLAGTKLATDGLIVASSVKAAALDDGRYVVSWKQHGGTTHADGMYVQVFKADGLADSESTYVDSEALDGYTPDQITVLTDGKFVIGAHHYGNTGNDVSEHIFNADGTLFKTIDNLHFNNASQLNPVTTALDNGGFVTAWMEGSTGSEVAGDIYLQRFDSGGNVVGDVTKVSGIKQYSSELKVLALSANGWVVFWSDHRNEDSGVFQQAFDSDGTAIGAAVRVMNETSTANISHLTALDDGGWTVTLGNGATRTFHIDPDNHAPLIFDSVASVAEDHVLSGNWANFETYDSDGDAIASFQITDVNVSGALTLNGEDVQIGDMINYSDMRHLKYVPPKDASGDALASFSAKAIDSHGAVSTDAAQFVINVAPVSDAPVSADVHRTIYENGAYHFQQSDFAFSDVDGDLPKDIYLAGFSYHGEIYRDGKVVHNTAHIKFADIGEYEWRPDEGYSHTATRQMKFKITDAGKAQYPDGHNQSSYYRFEIDVLPINHAPSGKNLNLHAVEDTSFTFDSDAFSFKDRDGDSLKSIVIDSLPQDGELKLGSHLVHAGQEISASDLSKLNWTPDENEVGTGLGRFTFRVRDDGGTDNGGVDTSQSEYTVTFSVKDTVDIITGTEDDDKLVGTTGKDIINGLGGDDVLNGGRGDNILIGGEGRDTFSVFHGGEDTIKDFNAVGSNHDKIDMRSSTSYESFSDLQGNIGQDGKNAIITGYGENGFGVLEIKNVNAADLTADCFLF
jgi:hypothetical protein